jgi:TetR/AcrR family transcriptional repressor of nem operon
MPPKDAGTARQKIIDAALRVVRAQGFAATSVEDLCAAAGVTKGAFFHHFKSKEELGVAAAVYWGVFADQVFAQAPYRQLQDPLQRVLGYIDFRRAILQGELPEYTCLVGTMVQEAYDTHPAIRDACNRTISDHAAAIAADIAEALAARGMSPAWSAQSLAMFTQAVLQGSFVLAKAANGPQIAAESLDHLRRYVELLFGANENDHEEAPAKAA